LITVTLVDGAKRTIRADRIAEFGNGTIYFNDTKERWQVKESHDEILSGIRTAMEELRGM
jgi:hypothetical protein